MPCCRLVDGADKVPMGHVTPTPAAARLVREKRAKGIYRTLTHRVPTLPPLFSRASVRRQCSRGAMQLQVHEDGSVVQPRRHAAPSARGWERGVDGRASTTTRCSESQRAFQLPAENSFSDSVAFGVLRSCLVDVCSMLSTINTKKVKVAVKGLLKICRTQAHVAAAALR